MEFQQIEELQFNAQYSKATNVLCFINNWVIKKSKNGKDYMQGIATSPVGSEISIICWNYSNKNTFKIDNNSCIILCNVIPKYLGNTKYLQFYHRSFLLSSFDETTKNQITQKCQVFKSNPKWQKLKQNCMFIYISMLFILSITLLLFAYL